MLKKASGKINSAKFSPNPLFVEIFGTLTSPFPGCLAVFAEDSLASCRVIISGTLIKSLCGAQVHSSEHKGVGAPTICLSGRAPQPPPPR